jgi:creatinine amidohydrolase
MAGPGVQLEGLTWPEAEEALASATVVVVPLGARLKEHGRHLPLNNDWIMAEYLIRRVLECCEVLATPTVQFGYYPAFVDYPGSIHLARETAGALVADVCRSLARHTDARFYVLNTGISTNWALEPMRLKLADEGLVVDYTDLRKAHSTLDVEQPRGSHADEVETSMMLFIAPEIVRMDLAETDCNPRLGPGPFSRDPDVATGIYSPTGAWGDPTLATVAKGERAVEELVAHLVADIARLADPDFSALPPRAAYLPR